MIEICFVCTGNTCRSPMAERIARKMAKAKKMKDIKFSSAGIFAKGDNISEKAVLTLKKMGYDSRSRKSVLLKKTKNHIHTGSQEIHVWQEMSSATTLSKRR